MDVSDILRDRMQEPAGLRRMVSASLMLHGVLIIGLLLAPPGLLTRVADTPRTIMTISLGGGGSGSTLDVGDFCCPDYLVLMVERIRSGWVQQAEVAGTVVVKFTIERDGRITQTSVEQSSGYATLDLNAQRAVAVTRQLTP